MSSRREPPVLSASDCTLSAPFGLIAAAEVTQEAILQ